MLTRLIYASRPSRALGIAEVDRILSASKQNNAAAHISGALIYTDHFFMQCLEGPRNDVNATYLRISADERHTDCVLLRYEHVDARLFAHWAMGRIQLAADRSPIVQRYSTHGMLDPYALNSRQAEMFMQDVAHVAGASKARDIERSLRTNA